MNRLLAFALAASVCLAADFDILIRNARVIDGSGNPWFKADIGITAGKIASIGHLAGKTAMRTIDASGRVVTPGFIDVHTHSESGIVRFPQAENFLRDGVTTIVTGNCGSSELDLKHFFSTLEKARIGLNVATLIGHNSVRIEVMGSEDRKATPQEMERMKAMVDKAMQAGAVGFSTGLEYVPGMFTPIEELVELAKVAAKYNGIYTTHMRDEGEGVLDAMKEAVEVGRLAGIRVQISHLKQDTKAFWGNTRKMIDLLEDYRSRGVDVTVDQYPYIAYSTGLSTTLPNWALAGGSEKLRERLRDPATRKKIFDEVLASNKRRGYDDFEYTAVASCGFEPKYEGKTIQQISAMEGKPKSHESDVETVLNLMERGGVSVVTTAMSEEDVANIMRYRNTAIASDGGVREFGAGRPHPRNYGTRARVLNEYVRQRKVLTLEDAVRKMTSLPAQIFQFKNRGLVREGFAADLVVFDPEAVRDNATFANPHQYSSGFDFVLVNGKVAVEANKLTPERGGQVIVRQ
jgi:N-acyl-D-amino-acid deacylase